VSGARQSNTDHNKIMSNANVYTQFEQRFPTGSHTAITIPEKFSDRFGSQLSYDQLRALSAQFANALVRLGVQPGDRICVQVDKSIANLALFLGALKIGAVYTPLNSAYTPAEMAYFLDDARPALAVVTPQARAALLGSATSAGVRAVETLAEDSSGSLSDMALAQSDQGESVPRTGDDTACIIYTSGTTGKPKGAMITHDNIGSNIHALWQVWHFQPGDVLLHLLPIYHVHGLFVALGTALYNGSPIIWLPRPDFDEAVRLLPEATVLMGVPTHYARLLERADFDAALCTRMRLFTAGSAPLLASTHRAFEARSGHTILERYGMTEAGMITSNPYDGERLPGSVGYPLPGISVRITNAEGQVLGPGEMGMVEVSGPNVFKGYWNRPDKTAETFTADGYLITGDQGVMSADGRLSIVGREKDMIISGGLNVYPKEVELELDELDCVGESAVIGVPHPDFGEGVVAVATRGPGAPLSESEIIDLLSSRLAKFKLPKKVMFVDELPRNAMGKVQKVELRRAYDTLFNG
jgi:malonyl-CoA/methylmalonyl-CoA synthetase